MTTHTRTPPRALSPPVERDSAGGGILPASVRAPIRTAETASYLCRPDIRPDQSARFQKLWEPEEKPRMPRGWWIVPAIALGLGGWMLLVALALWVMG